jgi:hypothetical protein
MLCPSARSPPLYPLDPKTVKNHLTCFGAIVDQQGDGTLKVSVYDVANTLQDSWSVGPNP